MKKVFRTVISTLLVFTMAFGTATTAFAKPAKEDKTNQTYTNEKTYTVDDTEYKMSVSLTKIPDCATLTKDFNNNNLLLVKKGNDYAIWTKNQISAEEQTVLVDLLTAPGLMNENSKYKFVYGNGKHTVRDGYFIINANGTITFQASSKWSLLWYGDYSINEAPKQPVVDPNPTPEPEPTPEPQPTPEPEPTPTPVKVTVEFMILNNTITFELNDTQDLTPGDNAIAPEDVPVVILDGVKYVFNGKWVNDSDEEVSLENITEDSVFYAVYDVYYEVKFMNGETQLNTETIWVKAGEKVAATKVPTATEEGKEFDGWVLGTGNYKDQDAVAAVVIDAPTVFDATFKTVTPVEPEDEGVLGEEIDADEEEGVLGVEFDNEDEDEAVLGETFVQTGDVAPVFVMVVLLLVSGMAITVISNKRRA